MKAETKKHLIISGQPHALMLTPELEGIVTELAKRGFAVAQPTKDILEDPYEPWNETNYFEIFDPESGMRMFSLHQFVEPLEITLYTNESTGQIYDPMLLIETLKELGVYKKRYGSPPKGISGPHEIEISEGVLYWNNLDLSDKLKNGASSIGENIALAQLFVITGFPAIAYREVKRGLKGAEWNPYYGTHLFWEQRKYLPSMVLALFETVSPILYWPARGLRNITSFAKTPR